MGVTFRSAGPPKHVFIGGRTIKDGEAAAVWNRWGVHQQIIGPRRIRLFSSTIRFLTRRKAGPHQYLRVAHRDGRVEHIEGGSSLYENPVFHDEVTVHDGTRLNSNSECIIVYKNNSQDTQNNKKKNDKQGAPSLKKDIFLDTVPTCQGGKRVILGPCLFIPEPDEHIHEFCWSTCNNDKETMDDDHREIDSKVHIIDRFTVLHMSNRTWALKLKFPTSDGFSFRIRLVIDFHIESIEKLISANDPNIKMNRSLQADSQVFGENISSKMLRTQREVTKKLAILDTYPNFRATAANCGLHIYSLRITGISLCDALQFHIVEEQEATAKLSSEYSEKAKRSKIRELDVEDRSKCIEQEAALKQMQVATNDKLDSESQKFNQAALDRKMALEKKEFEAQNEMLKIKDELVLNFLKEIKNMGVDMTKFMTTVGGLDVANQIIGRSEQLKLMYV